MKIDIFEPRTSSTLATIYDTTFLFDSFPPVKGEIASKEKPYTPIFSETTVFFLNFFITFNRFLFLYFRVTFFSFDFSF